MRAYSKYVLAGVLCCILAGCRWTGRDEPDGGPGGLWDRGGSHWANPEPPKWPDYSATTSAILYDSGQFKTAYTLLGEIEAAAAASTDPEAPAAGTAAGLRKKKKFAILLGPGIYQLFPDNEGWGLVAVARMQAEAKKWVACAATLQHERVPPATPPTNPYYWGDDLGTPDDPSPYWSQSAAPNPTSNARHYIIAIELKLPFADIQHQAAIHDALNGTPSTPGVKHLADDPTKRDARWAHVVAAYYAAQDGNWGLCRNELDQCE